MGEKKKEIMMRDTLFQSHSKEIDRHTFNYVTFSSLDEMNRFVDQQESVFSYGNRSEWSEYVQRTEAKLMKGSEWYGLPAPTSVKQLENHTTYGQMELLKTTRKLIESRLKHFLKRKGTEEMPRRKIAYNSMGLGVFSFDRAAIGLYKTRNSQGEERITTSVQDVYAYFLNKKVEQQNVRIYIVAGANGHVEGNQMMNVGLGATLLAEFLSERDFGVEISVIYGGDPLKEPSTSYMCITKIKKFENSLDKNITMVLTSDPKYFRYRGFKTFHAIYNKFGTSFSASTSRLVNDGMAKKFVDSLQAKNSFAYVFNRSYTVDEVGREIERILNDISKRG